MIKKTALDVRIASFEGRYREIKVEAKQKLQSAIKELERAEENIDRDIFCESDVDGRQIHSVAIMFRDLMMMKDVIRELELLRKNQELVS